MDDQEGLGEGSEPDDPISPVSSPQPSGLVPTETRAAWIGARNTGVDN